MTLEVFVNRLGADPPVPASTRDPGGHLTGPPEPRERSPTVAVAQYLPVFIAFAGGRADGRSDEPLIYSAAANAWLRGR
jgi:hypothetical protein